MADDDSIADDFGNDDFVQEDDAQDEDDEGELDVVEQKIAEEHSKFLEAQAKRQEEIRERQEEAKVLASQDPAAVAAVPRDDYVPPERPESASSGSMSHLRPARPMSADSYGRSGPSRLSVSGGPKPLLQGIAEEPPADTAGLSSVGELGTAAESSQSPVREPSMAAPVVEEEDDGIVADEGEGEEGGEQWDNSGELPQPSGQASGADKESSQVFTPIPGMEASHANEEGEASDKQPDHQPLPDQDHSLAGRAFVEALPLEDEAVEEEEAVPGAEVEASLQQLQQQHEDAGSEADAAEDEYEAVGEEEGEQPPADPEPEPEADAEEAVEVEEADADREVAWAEEGEEPEADASMTALPEPDSAVSPSGRDVDAASSIDLAPHRNSQMLQSQPTPLQLPLPPMEDEQAHTEAEPDHVLTPPASSRSHHQGAYDLDALAAAEETAAAGPAQGAFGDLMDPHDFAMQLLRHDIDVLPAHHKAQAAMYRGEGGGEGGAGGRSISPSLASYGYLGLSSPAVPGHTVGGGAGGDFDDDADGGASSRLGASSYANPNAPAGGRPASAPPMRQRGASRPASSKASASGASPARGHSARTYTAQGQQQQRRGAHGADAADEEGDGDSASQPLQGIKAAASADIIAASRALRSSSPGASGAAAPPSQQPQSAWREEDEYEGAGGQQAAGSERSMSVIDEEAASSGQRKVGYDEWRTKYDAQYPSSGGASSAAAGGQQGSRGQRPSTAPAGGQRRPASARPAASANQQAQQQGAYAYSPSHPASLSSANPAPLSGGRRTRPMSAQPQHMRGSWGTPTSGAPHPGGTGGGAAGGGGAGSLAGPAPLASSAMASSPMQRSGGIRSMDATAAVAVGGVTVSVYVADTMKRVSEANRWLDMLGSTRRYRLRSRLSAMEVELVEVAPEPDVEPGDEGDYGYGAPPPASPKTLKVLTLQQFLAAHTRLRQQAARAEKAALMAAKQAKGGRGGSPPRTHTYYAAGPQHGGEQLWQPAGRQVYVPPSQSGGGAAVRRPQSARPSSARPSAGAHPPSSPSHAAAAGRGSLGGASTTSASGGPGGLRTASTTSNKMQRPKSAHPGAYHSSQAAAAARTQAQRARAAWGDEGEEHESVTTDAGVYEDEEDGYFGAPEGMSAAEVQARLSEAADFCAGQRQFIGRLKSVA